MRNPLRFQGGRRALRAPEGGLRRIRRLCGLVGWAGRGTTRERERVAARSAAERSSHFVVGGRGSAYLELPEARGGVSCCACDAP